MKKINNKVFTGLMLLITLSSVLLSYNILLLGPIEKELRIIFIIGIILATFLFFVKYLKIKKNNSLKKSNDKLYILYASIYIIISLLISITINYLYGKINNVKRDYINYSTSIVVLKNAELNNIKDLDKKKMGIIDDTESPDGYVISQEIIKEYKLNDKNEITSYNSFTEMLNDLYNEELDAIFISSNYVTMFSQIEEFNDISGETKVIYKKNKRLVNKDNVNRVNKNVLRDPFTMLIMGVDSEMDGLNDNAAFNGDSLLLLTFNPKTLNTTIVSIPRDSYVPIACFNDKRENKITHAAWYGADCMMNTISGFTTIDIDYYLKVNFQALVSLVDAVGGVEIDVPYSFCEQDSGRRWGPHTVYVEEGLRTLNGEQALAFSRNRKTSSSCAPKWNTGNRSDLVRGEHQQLVIEALLKRFKNIKSLSAFNNILNSISKNFDTNMSSNEILSFYEIGKDVLRKDTSNDTIINLERLTLETSGQMIYDESMRLPLSNQVINKNSLNEVINIMEINLGKIKPKLIKTFNYEYNEEYEKTPPGVTNTPATLFKLLPSFIGSNKSNVEQFANANNLKVIYNVIKSSDSRYFDNQVIKQSEPATKRLDKIFNNTITIDVIEKVKATATERIDCNKDSDNPLCIMPDFENKTKLDVLTWINKIKGITIDWIEIDEDDTELSPNTVFEQNIEAGTNLESITSIQIKVVKEKSL